MRNSTRWVVGVLAAGAFAALALSGGARAQDGPPARALKIAVLNMGDCMEPAKNDHAKDLEIRFNAINKEAKDELTRIREKADKLKSQVENLRESGPGSPLYVQKATEWNLEEARYEIAKKMGTSQLIAARDAFQADIYSEVRKAATLVAQDMKVDLVLRSDEGAFETDKAERSIQKNMLRAVLYNDPSLDITQKVVTRVNEEFRKKKPVEYTCPKCKIVSKEPKCPRCGDPLKN